MSEYHYIKSEPGLWTVGTGTPGKGGNWEPESDHVTPESAAARVNFLNGGTDSSVNDELLDTLEDIIHVLHCNPTWTAERTRSWVTKQARRAIVRSKE